MQKNKKTKKPAEGKLETKDAGQNNEMIIGQIVFNWGWDAQQGRAIYGLYIIGQPAGRDCFYFGKIVEKIEILEDSSARIYFKGGGVTYQTNINSYSIINKNDTNNEGSPQGDKGKKSGRDKTVL